MEQNDGKAHITDLTEIKKQKEYQPFLKFTELVLEQIKLGNTRDDIVLKILDIRGGLKSNPREIKYFEDMVDLIFECYKNKGRDFKPNDKELLSRMNDNQKYLYKGEDGNYYATRADLEEANEYYKSQMLKNNPTRNI